MELAPVLNALGPILEVFVLKPMTSEFKVDSTTRTPSCLSGSSQGFNLREELQVGVPEAAAQRLSALCSSAQAEEPPSPSPERSRPSSLF